MTQRQLRRKYHANSHTEQPSLKSGHERSRTLRKDLQQERTGPEAEKSYHPRYPSLTTLIEQDAPLQSQSGLVLMYGPFQAELLPQERQGVASWIRECVRGMEFQAWYGLITAVAPRCFGVTSFNPG
ncbi:MAG: hypothetical protein K6T90_08395 [Leptolyngbyaceae cyanobacterium HOT.MB2.61]|nr:hypothetical protein [Leptolyngbyaceae cyanobacterium HOT.MB2.61]